MPNEYNQFLKDFLDDLDTFLYKKKLDRFEEEELILLYKKYDLLVKNIPEEKETKRFNLQNSFISIIPTIVACILAIWFFINQSNLKSENVVTIKADSTSLSNKIDNSRAPGTSTKSDSNLDSSEERISTLLSSNKKLKLQIQLIKQTGHQKNTIIEKMSELNQLLTELAYDLNANRGKYSWGYEISNFAKLNKSNVIKRDVDTLTDNDAYRVNRNFEKMMVLAEQIEQLTR